MQHHPWMQGYFVSAKYGHFAVTTSGGEFSLPNLPRGRHVLTAWHETLGTHSREITITGSESQTIDFVFKAKT